MAAERTSTAMGTATPSVTQRLVTGTEVTARTREARPAPTSVVRIMNTATGTATPSATPQPAGSTGETATLASTRVLMNVFHRTMIRTTAPRATRGETVTATPSAIPLRVAGTEATVRFRPMTYAWSPTLVLSQQFHRLERSADALKCSTAGPGGLFVMIPSIQAMLKWFVANLDSRGPLARATTRSVAAPARFGSATYTAPDLSPP